METNNITYLSNLPSSVIDTFEIPDEMAKELDQLITRVGIMKDILAANVNNQAAYDKLEAKLMPLQSRYSTIKSAITYQYVPAKYNSNDFSWVYPGYDLAGNICWIERT